MSEDAKLVIDGALALLDHENRWSPSGWGSAIRSTDDGCRCAVVALIHAQGLADKDAAAFVAACKAVASAAGLHDLDAIAAWNDTPGRTYVEVIGALRKAREIA